MKKYLLLLLFPLAISLAAQTGIQFSDQSWQQLLLQAEKENKLIFLDAYTTWCGPCRMMDKDVFPDKALGKYYNEHFINAQIDMEGEEGLPLSRKYQIKAYPSLLYINGTGEVVHRIVGYHEAEQLLEAGKTAMDPELNLKGLTGRFEAGEKDPDFLLKLAIGRANAMEDGHMEALEAYFETQKDWGTPENLELLFTFTDDLDSPLFDYLAQNRPDFEMLFGKEAVVQKLQYMVNQKLYQRVGESFDLEQVDQLYEKAYPDMAEQLSARFRVDYYRMAGDQEQLLEATINYLDKYQSEDAMELNNAAWNFFELVDDPAQLKKALAWAQRSVELDPGYYNHDTLASLYYKLGQKKKAIKTAKEAIRIANEQGEDASPTEALLNAIRTN